MPRRVRRPSDWNAPDLWKFALDDRGDRNARLYGHGATFYADLSVLTELWQSELNDVRLSPMGAPPNAAAKQPGPRPHEPSSAPALHPVTVGGGKTVLLAWTAGGRACQTRLRVCSQERFPDALSPGYHKKRIQ